MHTKAQGWGTDLMIGFVIFSGAIVFFYFYSFNYTNETEDILETLSYEGNFISDALLTEGSPTNWNTGNVKIIGITSNGKINQTKLEQFYSLAQTDYNGTKALFNTRYDYYFLLNTPLTINGSQIEGIGKPGINTTNLNPQNLLRITRFTIYENKPATAYTYIFKE